MAQKTKNGLRVLTRQEFEEKRRRYPTGRQQEFTDFYMKNVGEFDEGTFFQRAAPRIKQFFEQSFLPAVVNVGAMGTPFQSALTQLPGSQMNEIQMSAISGFAHGATLGANGYVKPMVKDWLVDLMQLNPTVRNQFESREDIVRGLEEYEAEIGKQKTAAFVGDMAGFFVPFTGAAKGVNALSKIPKLAKAMKPLGSWQAQAFGIGGAMGAIDKSLRPYNPNDSIYSMITGNESARGYQIAESFITTGTAFLVLDGMFRKGVPVIAGQVGAGVNRMRDRLPWFDRQAAWVQNNILSKPYGVSAAEREYAGRKAEIYGGMMGYYKGANTIAKMMGFDSFKALSVERPVFRDLLHGYASGKNLSKYIPSDIAEKYAGASYDQLFLKTLEREMQFVTPKDKGASIEMRRITELLGGDTTGALTKSKSEMTNGELTFSFLRDFKNTANKAADSLVEYKGLSETTRDVYRDAYVFRTFGFDKEAEALLKAIPEAELLSNAGLSGKNARIYMRQDVPTLEVVSPGQEKQVYKIGARYPDPITGKPIEATLTAPPGAPATATNDPAVLMEMAKDLRRQIKQSSPGAKVGIKKPLTEQQLGEMGEITDLDEILAMTFAHQQRLVNHYKYMDALGELGEGFVSSKQVKPYWNKLEGKHGEYGSLEGKYVSPLIERELKTANEMVKGGEAFYIEYMRFFRLLKTVGNFATHVHNIGGNFMFAYLDNLNPVKHAKAYGEAMDSVWKWITTGEITPLMELGMKGRLVQSEFMQQEAQQLMGRKLVEMSVKERPKNITEFLALFNEVITNSKLGKTYQSEDLLFKLASVRRHLDDAVPFEDAIYKTLNAYPDYSRVPQFLTGNSWKSAKNFPFIGAPFISFTHEAARILTNYALTQPTKLVSAYSMSHFITRYAQMKLGVTDEMVVEMERNSPNYRPGGIGMSATLLPFQDKEGNLLVGDMYYTLPLMEILEMIPGIYSTYTDLAYDVNLPDDPTVTGSSWFERSGARANNPVFSNPPTRVLAEQMFNKSLFTGKPIRQQTWAESPSDTFKDVADHVISTLILPNWASVPVPNVPALRTRKGRSYSVEGYGGKQMRQAVTGEDISSRPGVQQRDPTITALKVFGGLRADPVDAQWEMRLKVDEIKEAIARAKSNISRNPITSFEKTERVRKAALIEEYNRLLGIMVRNYRGVPPAERDEEMEKWLVQQLKYGEKQFYELKKEKAK